MKSTNKITQDMAIKAAATYYKSTEEIKVLDANFAKTKADLEKILARDKKLHIENATAAEQMLQAYAEQNPEFFTKDKSIQLAGVTIGYRLGKDTITLAEGVEEKNVLQKLMKLLPDFVSTKLSLNKAAINVKLDDAKIVKQLEKVGLEIKPATENFFIKVAAMIALLFVFASSNCQIVKLSNCDTTITTEAYTSYFSYKYHGPVLVTYKLYKGGGDCSRAGFTFKNDIPGLPCAKEKDYAHNGYDIGHQADAADFAYDCTLDELTFRFYNAVPQTPALNRGPWRSWETKIRKESQDDSLLISVGNVYQTTTSPGWTIGPDSIHVPIFCYKVVQSLTTGNVTHAIVCSNANTGAQCEEISMDALEKLIQK